MKIYYPPKPLLISIDQPLFSELEKRPDTIAEPKYNGTRLILKRIVDDGVLLKPHYEFWNRHGKQIKYQPSKEILEQLDLIEWKEDCALDGELVHFKTKKIKNFIVIFDIYLWDGFPTTGFSFKQRRKLLEEKFKILTEICAHNVVLAPQWGNNFQKVYNELIQHEEIEGLVIKSLNAKVELGRSESPVVKTMWKVRKPAKNYRF